MNAYASHVAGYLLAQSWQIAILAAFVALLSFGLRNRSPHVRYLLWLIVILWAAWLHTRRKSHEP